MATTIEGAIYEKLAGDTVLTAMLSGGTASPSVYSDQAPQGATEPYVVYSLASEADSYTLASRSWENGVYLVKAVDKSNSTTRAGSIAARIDAVLTDGALSISGRSHLSTRRTERVRYPETVSGVVYQHAGGYFRVYVS